MSTDKKATIIGGALLGVLALFVGVDTFSAAQDREAFRESAQQLHECTRWKVCD